MCAMASQITDVSIVYSAVCSDADQRKHQSSASLALWGDYTSDRWSPRTKGKLRGKYFHLMTSSCTSTPPTSGTRMYLERDALVFLVATALAAAAATGAVTGSSLLLLTLLRQLDVRSPGYHTIATILALSKNTNTQCFRIYYSPLTYVHRIDYILDPLSTECAQQTFTNCECNVCEQSFIIMIRRLYGIQRQVRNVYCNWQTELTLLNRRKYMMCRIHCVHSLLDDVHPWDGTYTEYPGVTAGHWCIECDDGFGLQTQ